MMGALAEVDPARIADHAREQNLSPEDALPRLLDEAVAAARRAGRDVAEATGQELIYSRADLDRDRPATLSADAGFSGDRERAEIAYHRWNDALAERATLLRTFLRGEDIFREWIDDTYRKELDGRWLGKDDDEIRRLIESSSAASADHEPRLRSWWRLRAQPHRD